MNIQKPKAFVIGGAGYIGKPLLERSAEFFSSIGTSSSTSSTGLLHLSLEDPLNFEFNLISPGDTIFFTAAISSPDICDKNNAYARNINVTGAAKFILRAMEMGARIIFFSSDTIYGERELFFNETSNIDPAGSYAQMKSEIENQFINEPLFKSIRLSYVFSREDKFTKYLIDCEKMLSVAEIFHPFSRSIIHRDDVVTAAIALAQRWSDIPQRFINFGGPEVISRLDFAKLLKDIALPNLIYQAIEPTEEFFKNRPRSIAMRSDILPILLGRSAHTLSDAARIEFNKKLF